MAYAPSAVAPRDFAPARAPASNSRAPLRRFLDAVLASRQRQVDREIAHIASFVEAVLDVLADADRQACAARAHYPLAD